jgi:hypothetical protein
MSLREIQTFFGETPIQQAALFLVAALLLIGALKVFTTVDKSRHRRQLPAVNVADFADIRSAALRAKVEAVIEALPKKHPRGEEFAAYIRSHGRGGAFFLAEVPGVLRALKALGWTATEVEVVRQAFADMNPDTFERVNTPK